MSPRREARLAKFKIIAQAKSHRWIDDFDLSAFQFEPIRQLGNLRRRASHSAERRDFRNENPSAYLHWRESVLLRDDYRCVVCGATNQLEADHIKPWSIYPELRFDISNGQTLCKSCHKKTATYGTRVQRIISVHVD